MANKFNYNFTKIAAILALPFSIVAHILAGLASSQNLTKVKRNQLLKRNNIKW